MMTDERDLVMLLVEASGTNRDYVRNAEFKAGVTVLAQLLPSMVQGMAQEAAKRQGERERQVSIYERMSTPMLLKDLGLTEDQLRKANTPLDSTVLERFMAKRAEEHDAAHEPGLETGLWPNNTVEHSKCSHGVRRPATDDEHGTWVCQDCGLPDPPNDLL